MIYIIWYSTYNTIFYFANWWILIFLFKFFELKLILELSFIKGKNSNFWSKRLCTNSHDFIKMLCQYYYGLVKVQFFLFFFIIISYISKFLRLSTIPIILRCRLIKLNFKFYVIWTHEFYIFSERCVSCISN